MVTTFGVYIHILQPQIQTFFILMIYVKILGEISLFMLLTYVNIKINQIQVYNCCPFFFSLFFFSFFHYIFLIQGGGGGVARPLPPPLWIRQCTAIVHIKYLVQTQSYHLCTRFWTSWGTLCIRMYSFAPSCQIQANKRTVNIKKCKFQNLHTNRIYSKRCGKFNIRLTGLNSQLNFIDFLESNKNTVKVQIYVRYTCSVNRGLTLVRLR